MRSLLARIRLEELTIVLILAFFGVAGAIPGIAPNQAAEMTGTAATRLQLLAGIGSQLLVNGIIVFFLVRHKELWRPHWRSFGWASSLAVWALLSLLWSQDPLITARRVVPFALAAAFGMFLVLRFPPQRFLALLQRTFLLLACGSAVLALLLPSTGLDASTGHGGDWQGVFTQKNACGRAMVFALASLLASGRFNPWRTGLLLLFAGELALSGSRGAWLLGALVVFALLALRASCRLDRQTRTAFLLTVSVASIGLAAVAWLGFDDLAVLMGRDPTLTGRTAIWHEVWIAIKHRPLLGYGFSAFWRGAQGASWNVVVALGFVLFHAHNGFLEIWLELGAVGLLLFTVGFLRAAVLLAPELRAGRYREAAWPLAVLLLVALYDLDENTLLSFNGLFWVLYTAALMQIERQALDRAFVRRHLPAHPPARTALFQTADAEPAFPAWWISLPSDQPAAWLYPGSASEMLSVKTLPVGKPRRMAAPPGEPWL